MTRTLHNRTTELACYANAVRPGRTCARAVLRRSVWRVRIGRRAHGHVARRHHQRHTCRQCVLDDEGEFDLDVS